MEDLIAMESAESWSSELHRRFVELARRRVPEDEAEDLVQEAMTVVLTRSGEIEEARLVEGRPPLAWCFTVLRNTIGNYYQRRERWAKTVDEDAVDRLHAEGTPAEALESKELRIHIHQALQKLRGSDPQCWGFLSRLGDGIKPRSLAQSAGLEEAVLYRRLYRCRQKFRHLLEERGVRP
jgi:RNA polymerase sigma factor (sigma-70 family)